MKGRIVEKPDLSFINFFFFLFFFVLFTATRLLSATIAYSFLTDVFSIDPGDEVLNKAMKLSLRDDGAKDMSTARLEVDDNHITYLY